MTTHVHIYLCSQLSQVATVSDYIQGSSGRRFPHKCYADIHNETYKIQVAYYTEVGFYFFLIFFFFSLIFLQSKIHMYCEKDISLRAENSKSDTRAQ